MSSTEDVLREIIEIRNPEIDDEEVIGKIGERLDQRRAQAEEEGLDYEAFARGQPVRQGHVSLGYDLHYSLQQMEASYNRIEVELSLTESRIPIIAPLIQRVRKALHRLVLYYTNRLAGRQSRFNEYALKAMTELIKEIEEENRSLHLEISELEGRLEDLEARAD